MAIRQYIGARYVPRFLGTYDNTQIYDALDVVDNGSGTSYIARKTVPAGTPLIDTDYWFVYGASSGAIYDLQTRMGNAENAIIGNTNDITALDGRVDDLESDKYIFIGDSYQWGYHNGEQVRSFLDWLALDNPDMEYYHAEQGGAGFTVTGKTFLGLLQGLESGISDKRAVKSIVVCAGYNDQDATASAITNAIGDFVTYAKGKYPLATVYVGFIGCSKASGNSKYGLWTAIGAYRNCSSVGAVYIDNSENIVHDYKNMFDNTDNSHPTESGYHKIANFLNNWLNGGTLSVKRGNATAAMTVNTSIFNDKAISFLQRQENDAVYISNQSTFTLTVSSPPYALAVNTGLKIGTLEKVYALGMPYKLNSQAMTFVVDIYGGSTERLPGYLTINEDNEVLLYFIYGSTLNIQNIYVPGFNIVLASDAS